MNSALPLLLLFGAAAEPLTVDIRFSQASQVAGEIDRVLAKHWSEMGLQPVAIADDATFVRRVYLDLTGRIPTREEAQRFVSDGANDKRAKLIKTLLSGSEYPAQMARMLDRIIQEQHAGSGEFIDYLRDSIAQHKSWDNIFREMMVGPWETKEAKRATAFLNRRLNSLDDLTNDTSRVFFGVNVSCAKCHDHPLVEDWKQDHYFGMASFFQRTVEGSKKKKKDEILEAEMGEVKYTTTKGEQRTAKVMFLSNRTVDAPKDKKVALREELVKIAVEDGTFFRRALVNRLWANFMGRGLVDPVDQLHSANPPTVPTLLESLGNDFAKNGYDIDRMVAGMMLSRSYQLVSRGPTESAEDAELNYARAMLRPLTPHQFAASIILASSEEKYDVKRLDGEARRLTGAKLIDVPGEKFQSSAGEALFMSNHPEVQKIVQPTKTNLVGRLAEMKDSRQLVETAIWTILSRPPEAEEHSYLANWIDQRAADKPKACSQLVWALLMSAEFRFNH